LASLELRVEQKKKSIGSADFIGGSATAFSAFKVSAKNGLFLGQMTGRHLSGSRMDTFETT
jgi:hypothetical protein